MGSPDTDSFVQSGSPDKSMNDSIGKIEAMDAK